MKEEGNISFLTDTPVGTTMYLVIQNRVNTEIWVKEAVYQGFVKHYRQDSYMDCMKMSSPCSYTVTEYHVKFTVNGKPITVICDSPAYWKGQRGYDTNEHLECGANFKTKMKVHVSGCIDIYFTTCPKAFKNYMNTDSALNNINKNIDERIAVLQKMKDDLNNMVNKIVPSCWQIS